MVKFPKTSFTSEPKFHPYRIGDVVDFFFRKCKLNNEKTYQLVTVKRRNEGIVDRGIFKGKEIKTPTQFYIEKGDFLISKRQIVHGACEIVPEKFNNAIVSNEYTVIRGKKEYLLTEYFNLLSKTPFMKKCYFLSSYGVDIEKMVFNVEDWKKRTIYIPCLFEQQKIVDFFTLLDRRIKKQQEKVEAFREYKKSMLQKLFSRDLRFKDENGEEFPKWEIRSVGEIAVISKGYTPDTKESSYWDDDLKNWLSIAGMKEKYIIEGNKGVTSIGELKHTRVAPNTLIMSFKLTIGKLAIIKKPIFTNEAICHFNWKVETVNTEYMYYYFTFINIASFGMQAVKGITLNNDSLNSIPIKLPSIKEQQKIANFLSKIDEKIEKEEAKLEVLQEQKKGFMQQMFI